MISKDRYKYIKLEEAPKEKTVTSRDRLSDKERADNMARLWRYKNMWDNMADFRRRRLRNKAYANGDQWSDFIEIEKGKWITEAENIRMQGKVPLKNNVISHIVNSVLGVFRENYSLPEVTARVRDNQTVGEMNTNMLEYVYQINDIKELDVASIREYMYSGVVAQMVDYLPDHFTRQSEIEITPVNPTRLILPSNILDPRGKDIRCIGVLMDMSLDDVVSRFATSEAEEKEIRVMYSQYSKDNLIRAYKSFGKNQNDKSLDFFWSQSSDVCRVIQMWELVSEKALRVTDRLDGREYIYPFTDKEALEKAKNERDVEIRKGKLDPEKSQIEIDYFNDQFWYVRYLTPFGDVLYEGRTPFDHNDHPFAMQLGHLIDGEIHSYIENIIDQQRYINRLITLSDFIIGSSAKGVLVFPENAIPKDMNKEDVLKEWVAHNGVIFANLKPGMQMPQQIANNCTNIGINELLSMQLSLIRDIAGIHGAMQGKDAKSGQSATLYMQESANAQTNIRDLIDSFIAFRRRRDYKIVMVAPQCYTAEFYMAVSGDHDDAQMWNPIIASSAPRYVQISETNNTVAYRSAMNEFLLKAMEMRMADLKTVLKGGNFPYADKVIRIIEEEEAKAMQQQAMQQQAMLQGQAQGQQMLEAGATEGQVLQAGADSVQQAIDDAEYNDIQNIAGGANPEAMQMMMQGLR